MAVKKQPDSDTGELCEAANDWLRWFLEELEVCMVKTGQRLSSASVPADYHFAAMQAVRLALRESGMDDEEVCNLFGRVAIENLSPAKPVQWNADRNRRRFELIDSDIQNTLSPAEQIELAGLTQLMREQVDSEINLPFEGARKLHRLLTDMDGESADSEQ